MQSHPTNRRPSADHGRLFLGLFVVALGIVFWLDQLGTIDLDPRHLATYWPLILIVLGIGKLLSGRDGGGVVLLVLGGLFLANNLGVLPFDDGWPLLLVALGGLMIFRALREKPKEGKRHE